MEGVKSLLHQLSPKAIEDDFERKGKKAGTFSNKYEALWKFYEDRHRRLLRRGQADLPGLFLAHNSRRHTLRAPAKTTKVVRRCGGQGPPHHHPQSGQAVAVRPR